MSTRPILTICCSCAFYRQAVELQEQLEALGFEVVVPSTALEMKQTGNFDVDSHKTWFQNESDYTEKAALMREHFDKIAEGDAILVLNYEKRGKPNYIGPNVLMEMSLGFYQRKPIFVLNDLPQDSPFEEELKGMLPVILHGKIDDLLQQYEQLAAD